MQSDRSFGLGNSLFAGRRSGLGDLHSLIDNEDRHVRWCLTKSLGTVFTHLTDGNKNLAQLDLHRLAQDEDPYVRGRTAHTLGLILPNISNKNFAWGDLQ